jgi:D-3-phosphoglycerate dehydrogenase / 2-oxoglutarate reductase
MLKIAVTDYAFPDLDVEAAIFNQTPHTLVAWKARKPPEELLKLVRDADAVVTQFATINAEVIGSMERAKVIVRYGIGVDNVDLAAARTRGIPVCNVPDYCVDEVSDHTLAFILASTRQVVPNTLLLGAGKWGIATPLASMQALSNLTVGVIGFGRIGRGVVRRLVAFNARVLVFDPMVSSSDIEKAGATKSTSLGELLPLCDFITPHCPSTEKTKKMFDSDTFTRMKTGAIFINVGRGDLADSAALVRALESGKLGGAALDVFDPEPIPSDSPLLKMPNVILSAHIASASPQAARKLRETAAGIVVKALSGEALPNVVNKA